MDRVLTAPRRPRALDREPPPEASRILKENVYKRVELWTMPDGGRQVVKTFQGHAGEDLRRNARRTYLALESLRDLFAGVVRLPEPLALDEERYRVAMEYLDGLDASRPLSLRLLARARPFFAICHQAEGFEFLPGLADSVLATPGALVLMESGFPMRLGFKGDLAENLRWTPEGLCMADVETACLEPLGLSELCLILHVWTSRLPLSGGLGRILKPVAFASLSPAQRKSLCRAALEFWAGGYLRALSGFRRRSKIRRGERALAALLARP